MKPNQTKTFSFPVAGVDISRFAQDVEYKRETILGLAMWVKGWTFDILPSLKPKVESNEGNPLHLFHISRVWSVWKTFDIRQAANTGEIPLHRTGRQHRGDSPTFLGKSCGFFKVPLCACWSRVWLVDRANYASVIIIGALFARFLNHAPKVQFLTLGVTKVKQKNYFINQNPIQSNSLPRAQEEEVFSTAMSLAVRYNVSQWEMLMTHLEWLFSDSRSVGRLLCSPKTTQLMTSGHYN